VAKNSSCRGVWKPIYQYMNVTSVYEPDSPKPEAERAEKILEAPAGLRPPGLRNHYRRGAAEPEWLSAPSTCTSRTRRAPLSDRRAKAKGAGGPEATASPSAPSDVERLSNPQFAFWGGAWDVLGRRDSSRRKPEAEARRREILEAAVRVFARRGFHAATIAEVAAEAGVAVGSIYLCFKTKQELYSVW